MIVVSICEERVKFSIELSDLVSLQITNVNDLIFRGIVRLSKTYLIETSITINL
jgi:hypothetical protein